jgi:hypothetical protein
VGSRVGESVGESVGLSLGCGVGTALLVKVTVRDPDSYALLEIVTSSPDTTTTVAWLEIPLPETLSPTATESATEVDETTRMLEPAVSVTVVTTFWWIVYVGVNVGDTVGASVGLALGCGVGNLAL